MKNIKKVLILLGISLFLFIFIKTNNVDDFVNSILNIDIKMYLILVILQIITILLLAYQWYLLLNKNSKISFIKVLQINLASTFIESVTPSSKLGGEGAKIYLLKQNTNLNYSQITSKMIIHKLIMFLPFLILNLIFLSISIFIYNIPLYIFIIFIILLAIFLTMFLLIKLDIFNIKNISNNFIKKFITFINVSFESSKKELNKKEFTFLTIISAFIWFMYPVKIFLVTKALNFEIPFILIVIATLSSYCVSILPLTPGGLGTFESVLALIISTNSMQYLSFSSGMGIAMVSRSITFWIPLIFSIIASLSFVLFTKNKNKKEDNFMHTNNISIHNYGKNFSVKKILNHIKNLEFIMSKNKLFAKFYHNLVYTKMVENEIKYGNISSKSRVVHLGSGPYPMTAIQLIEKGIRVDCIDYDYNAINYSRKLVEKYKNNHLIKIIHCDANNIDFSKYNIIILSLHIFPKDLIIENILKKADKGTKILYRNPRNIFNKWYPKYYPKKGFSKIEKIKQPFNKEGVFITI